MASDNILVAIKSRPFITREKSEKLRPQWNAQKNVVYQIDEDGHRIGEPYSFDHIFNENSSNEEVYNAVVQPLVNSCLKGFNSTIFAYGQTSSGKTHTMMGTDNTLGIIQIAVNDIFKQVEQNKHRRYLMSCSYFEIYNEKINDLLDKNGQDLKIRENFYGNTFVNAKEEVVTDASQVLELMKVGNKIRKIGCTNLNERSSRSHTIFRFTIESTENEIENGPVQISQLNLVDLAGSERVAQTKAEGVRLKEGVNINKSLSVLGNVIRQLSESEGYINYRDSKLTRLLQHALGGNAKSLIIATITSAVGEETKSTLEFAQRAKVVKNKPIINEILTEQDKLKQYERITAGYKKRLETEQLRIQQMEREKEQTEKEILKLKQHVKLIDVFTKGPKTMKTESKICRRHTVGHYGSRFALQTIPESSILPSCSQDVSVESDTNHDLDEEKLFLKIASQETDAHFKTVLEESLEEILSSTPESSPECALEQEVEKTPSHYLRKRLKCLEDSYISLQEFTKLEAECKEQDKGLVEELINEKENLLRDLVNLNIKAKEEKEEKDKIKLELEDQLSSLSKELEYQQKKNSEFASALEQAEREKENLKKSSQENQQLRETNERYKEEIRQMQSRFSQYEKREQEDRDIVIIQGVSTQTELDNTDPDIKNEVEAEIERNKAEKALTDKKEETVQLLLEKNEYLERQLLEMEQDNEDYKKKIAVYREYEEDSKNLKKKIQAEEDKIKLLLEKVDSLETYKLEMEQDNEKYRKQITTHKETEKSYENLKNEFRQKEEAIQLLQNKIEHFESCVPEKEQDNDNYKKEISVYGEHEEDSENLKRDILEKEHSIKSLLEKVANLEMHKSAIEQEIEQYRKQIIVHKETEKSYENLKKELKQKEEAVELLLKKIEYMESHVLEIEQTNDNYKKEITVYRERQGESENLKKDVQEKENTIKSLLEKVHSLELYKTESKQEIVTNNKETEKSYESLKKEFELKEEAIVALLKKIEYLENRILEMEQDNDNHKKEITVYREHEKESENLEKNVQEKEDNIKSLLEKVANLEKCKLETEQDNEKYKKQITDYKKTEEFYENLKEEIQQKEEAVQVLLKKIEYLESHVLEIEQANDNYKKEITVYREHEGESEDLKKDVQEKEENIKSLLEKVANLETCKLETEQDNEKYKKQITDYKKTEAFYENLKEEIQQKEEAVQVLLKKIEYLENHVLEIEQVNDNYQKEITVYRDHEGECEGLKKDVQEKEDIIKSLLEKVANLETCKLETEQDNEKYRKQIIVYKKTEECYENLKAEVKQKDEEVQVLLKEIEYLENRVLELEQANDNYKKEITEHERESENLKKDVREKEDNIKSLLEKVTNLETCKLETEQDNEKYRKQIIVYKKTEDSYENLKEEVKQKEEAVQVLLRKIEYFESCVQQMEQDNDNYKKEITIYREHERESENLKKDVQEKENNIKSLLEKVANLEMCKLETEQENQQYRKQITVHKETEKSYENLKKECKQKEEAIQLLVKKIEYLESRVLETEQANENYKKEITVYREHERENENLRKDVQKNENNIESLLETVHCLEMCKLEIERDNEKYRKQITDYKKTEESCEDLKEEVKRKEEMVEVLLRKIKYLESRVQQMEQDNDNLQKEIQEKEDNLKLLLKKVDSLEMCKSETERDNEKFKKQVTVYKETEKNNENLRKEMEQKEDKIKLLLNENKNWERSVTEMEQDKENYKRETIAFKENEHSTEKLKKEIEQKENRIKLLLKKIDELQIYETGTKPGTNKEDKNIIRDLQEKIRALSTDNEQLKMTLKHVKSETEQEKRKNCDLERKISSMYMDNVSLTTKIYDLENTLTEVKSNLQTEEVEKKRCLPSLSSPTSTFFVDLSPREIRRRKRQSIYDQRRGISADASTEEDVEAKDPSDIEKELMERIAKLTHQVEHLTGNRQSCHKCESTKNQMKQLEELQKKSTMTSVELERKIDDLQNKYQQVVRSDPDEGIKAKISNGLENVKGKRQSCQECESMKNQMKHLEELQKKNTVTIVELQTKIDDLRNKHQVERSDPKGGIEAKISSGMEKELRKTIAKLTLQVEELTCENNFLESEVQGFMRELDDCKRYNHEQDTEIEDLKQQLERVKTKQQDCRQCEERKKQIKQLEELQKKNMFRIVELQTKIYDLQNTYTVEKRNHDDEVEYMKQQIAILETRLNKPPKELKNTEVQCDLMNYEQLLEKYSFVKKLARVRRDEGNILRARLGMNPDEPVT